MKILLDTCAFIWAVAEPERLSAKARDAMMATNSAIYYSPISCAEIACLCERGRLVLDVHWKTWFDRYSGENGWSSVDITLPVIQDAFALPGSFHADPADRIIVGTARCQDMQLITADRKLLDYPFVKTIWA